MHLFKLKMTVLLLVVCWYSHGQKLAGLEYFYDTDPGVGNGTYVAFTNTGDSVGFDFAVDITGLGPGFHRLYIRSQFDNGVWSIQEGRAFYVLLPSTHEEAPQVSKAEYFFDTDPGIGNGEALTVVNPGDSIDQLFDVSVAGLSTGFHLLYLRMQNARGQWSLAEPRSFYVLDASFNEAAPEITGGEYFFNEDPGVGNGTSFALNRGDSIDERVAISITGLSPGYHQLHFRLQDAAGRFGSVEHRTFYVIEAASVAPSAPIMAVEYFFNEDPGVGNGTPVASDLNSDQIEFDFAVELTGREMGQDTLYVRVTDANGISSLYQYAVFEITDQTADLTVTGLAVESRIAEPGTSLAATFTISNVGNLPVEEAFLVGYYLSSDDTWSDDDQLLSTSSVSHKISAASGVEEAHHVPVPAETEAGEYYLLVYADYDNDVAEFDDHNNFSAVAFTVNSSPAVENQTFTIAELSEAGTVVGIVEATDPDGDELAYSITEGNENGAFAMDASSGELTVADQSQLDFETSPSFVLAVEVSDDKSTSSATITVELTDVNEAPEISEQTFPLAENSASGTAVGTIAATDPDDDELTYSITGGNDGGVFALAASTGELTVADPSQLDYEANPEFVLTVEVSDGELTATATVTVSLTDVDESQNQSPQIADQTFTIAENSANGTAVGTIAATDPDGDELTFSITGGNDGGVFALAASTGELTVADPLQLDYEANPEFVLTVEVSDGALTASATITIGLEDVDESLNQSPQILDQTFTIAENSANGTVVGTIAATDPDDDELTFSITGGNDGGVFALAASTGELTVADQSQLDYEANPEFVLTVEVSDGELTATATVTVALTDVDESQNQSPQIADQIFTIAENSASGTAVGTIAATDPDDDELFFSITDGNAGGAFALAASTGELTVADQSQLDYEANPEFVLTVKVSDGELTATATVTVALTDVDESQNQSPQIADQIFTIAENSESGTSVGTIAATDPDDDELFFSITDGNAGGAFALDESTGELTVANPLQLDYEANPEFVLTVEVSDGQTVVVATVTIELTQADDPLGTQPEEPGLTVYPNPVKSIVTIEADQQFIGAKAYVVDMLGKVVESFTLHTKSTMDLHEFTAGIYLIKIVQNGKTTIIRLTKAE